MSKRNVTVVYTDRDLTDMFIDRMFYDIFRDTMEKIHKSGLSPSDFIYNVLCKYTNGIDHMPKMVGDEVIISHSYLSTNIIEGNIDIFINLPSPNFSMGFCNALRPMIKEILTKDYFQELITLKSMFNEPEKENDRIYFEVVNWKNALVLLRR